MPTTPTARRGAHPSADRLASLATSNIVAVAARRYLKANTVKKRTLSLLNQGLMHYGALGELLRQQRVFRDVFGLI